MEIWRSSDRKHFAQFFLRHDAYRVQTNRPCTPQSAITNTIIIINHSSLCNCIWIYLRVNRKRMLLAKIFVKFRKSLKLLLTAANEMKSVNDSLMTWTTLRLGNTQCEWLRGVFWSIIEYTNLHTGALTFTQYTCRPTCTMPTVKVSHALIVSVYA